MNKPKRRVYTFAAPHDKVTAVQKIGESRRAFEARCGLLEQQMDQAIGHDPATKPKAVCPTCKQEQPS